MSFERGGYHTKSENPDKAPEEITIEEANKRMEEYNRDIGWGITMVDGQLCIASGVNGTITAFAPFPNRLRQLIQSFRNQAVANARAKVREAIGL